MTASKLDCLDFLLLAKLPADDAERAYWQAQWVAVEEAAKARKVKPVAVAAVLTRLVLAADDRSLRCDQAVSQLAAKTKLSDSQVKRTLALLDELGLVTIIQHGGGRNRRPTVRSVQFVAEARQRTEVIQSRTEVIQRRTEVTSDPHYGSTTETPYPTKVSAQLNGRPGSVRGGTKAQEGKGSWADQLAWHVAKDMLDLEKQAGKADGVRDPAAVIRANKLPRAQERVEVLKRRSDYCKLQLLEPDDSDLVRGLAMQALDGDTSGTTELGRAIRRANDLWAASRAAG